MDFLENRSIFAKATRDSLIVKCPSIIVDCRAEDAKAEGAETRIAHRFFQPMFCISRNIFAAVLETA